MLFNSIDFALFLPIAFVIYWFWASKKLGRRNLFIVAASYLFYGWWDWRFLSLILFSTIVDFWAAQKIQSTENKSSRKSWLTVSLLVNLGLLGTLKYFNFFLDNFVELFTLFGQEFQADRLDVVLPVGISFYTFQTLSYTIDVYRKDLEATKDPIAFAAYVSFFPQLVAGPIERATNLLPQFYSIAGFRYQQAVDGMRQILWGLFKKIVIADNCARYVDFAFKSTDELYGSTLLIGAVFFAFQIYGDFSGYSDIAIGTARLFGFKLRQNFAFPYFSRDIAEFWRRWHISLSTWFRDYLYIPLGGSRGNRFFVIRNVFIIFLVSGFWHGANWTFIVWGGLNALLFIPLLLVNRNRRHLEVVAQGKTAASLKEIGQVLLTFLLTVLCWVFFRADNLGHAFDYLGGMIDPSIIAYPKIMDDSDFWIVSVLLIVFTVIEWLGREGLYALEKIGLNWPKGWRWAMYYGIVLIILIFGRFEQNSFIYFQF